MCKVSAKNIELYVSWSSSKFSIFQTKMWFLENNRALSDSNGIGTHNHLGRKRTLNHLAKLAKWLSCVVSTYLYGAFDCMFLSCQVRVSEWIHTLYLPQAKVKSRNKDITRNDWKKGNSFCQLDSCDKKITNWRNVVLHLIHC